MYTLRRISKEGVEMNFSLGSSYTMIHKQSAPEEFEKDYSKFNNVYPDGDIYCFIYACGGSDEYPLFKGQQAYIMTDSGKTLSNLTLKE